MDANTEMNLDKDFQAVILKLRLDCQLETDPLFILSVSERRVWLGLKEYLKKYNWKIPKFGKRQKLPGQIPNRIKHYQSRS